MRQVTYRSVLEEAFGLLGLTLEEAATNEVTEMTTHVNRRLRLGWEYFPWPELMRLEPRAKAGDGSAGWYIPWEASGSEPLGEVFGVYTGDPRTSPTVSEVGYGLSDRGVELLPGQVPETPWVSYRLRPVRMTAAQIDGTRGFAAGELGYYAADGNVYQAGASGAAVGATPDSDPAAWTLVPFPALLAPYVAYGAYVDFLKGDRAQEKAKLSESDAQALLDEEILKIVGQQNQRARGWNVRQRAAPHGW
ncbi:MAG: hypothetical protein D6781_01585 [Verrucomicrobia bacterium]|nr:MAG: hypothetical protein D6781_01585 [Verrucomicrobiota bacterium]